MLNTWYISTVGQIKSKFDRNQLRVFFQTVQFLFYNSTYIKSYEKFKCSERGKNGARKTPHDYLA